MKYRLIMVLLLLLGAQSTLTTLSAQERNKVTVHNDKSGRDEVIDLPEAMEMEADSLLKEWSAKKYLVPDTNCENPDVNPYFEPDVYKNRLKRLPTVMEMPYNSVVQKFIDQYSGRLRQSVSYMLGASNFYIPIFEEALDRYNLPLELKYLPVIESALNPKAVSRVGAVGLWQFMLKTAKRYNLQVNSLVDERRDPIKATFAAAHYLSDLYKIYGDWNLVIAAYNCGPNAISRAIHRAGGAKDYWTIYPYLPMETRGYVPAFIAANYIMNYYCEHNICPMKATIPLTTDTIMLSRDVHMEQISAVCKIDLEEIKALNPQYKTTLIPGNAEPSALCLPQETLNTFIDAKDSVYNYRYEELFTKRDSVAVDESVAAQPRHRRSHQSRQREEVSETRSSRSRSSRNSRRSSSKKSRRKTKPTKSVTIKDGESLSTIAERHHTTVSKLRKLNKISGSSIRAGKKLKVK